MDSIRSKRTNSKSYPSRSGRKWLRHFETASGSDSLASARPGNVRGIISTNWSKRLRARDKQSHGAPTASHDGGSIVHGASFNSLPLTGLDLYAQQSCKNRAL